MVCPPGTHPLSMAPSGYNVVAQCRSAVSTHSQDDVDIRNQWTFCKLACTLLNCVSSSSRQSQASPAHTHDSKRVIGATSCSLLKSPLFAHRRGARSSFGALPRGLSHNWSDPASHGRVPQRAQNRQPRRRQRRRRRQQGRQQTRKGGGLRQGPRTPGVRQQQSPVHQRGGEAKPRSPAGRAAGGRWARRSHQGDGESEESNPGVAHGTAAAHQVRLQVRSTSNLPPL